MWTRDSHARSEASLSEASSSAGLRNYFSISFSRIRSAPWNSFRKMQLRSKHCRGVSASGGFRASLLEPLSTSGGVGVSILSSVSLCQKAPEQAFSSISRRQEASERAFSSIFDVWGLRSEHFRAFSTSGGFGASIFEVSRGEQRAICAKAPPSSREPLRKHCIDVVLSS